MSRIVEIMSLIAVFENHQSVVCIKSDRILRSYLSLNVSNNLLSRCIIHINSYVGVIMKV